VTGASRDQLARVVRQHAGQLAASLMHETGDFAAAEDLVQDAVLAALQHWPEEGIPRRPDAWLFTVARRRGLDMMRRQANYLVKLAQLRRPVQPAPDDRLRLIFTCCHPGLPGPAQIALTLRVVCGLTTAQIARAFRRLAGHGGQADRNGFRPPGAVITRSIPPGRNGTCGAGDPCANRCCSPSRDTLAGGGSSLL